MYYCENASGCIIFEQIFSECSLYGLVPPTGTHTTLSVSWRLQGPPRPSVSRDAYRDPHDPQCLVTPTGTPRPSILLRWINVYLVVNQTMKIESSTDLQKRKFTPFLTYWKYMFIIFKIYRLRLYLWWIIKKQIYYNL